MRPAPLAAMSNRPTNEILLTGEVVANDDGGGPRLAIEVVPFDATGRVESFDGKVSLMLLVPMTGACAAKSGPLGLWPERRASRGRQQGWRADDAVLR